MANIVYLDQNEPRPEFSEYDSWLFIDEIDGRFCGSGGAWKKSGDWVGYGSLIEDDVSLDRAIQAAQIWAGRFNVKNIYVFLRNA